MFQTEKLTLQKHYIFGPHTGLKWPRISNCYKIIKKALSKQLVVLKRILRVYIFRILMNKQDRKCLKPKN